MTDRPSERPPDETPVPGDSGLLPVRPEPSAGLDAVAGDLVAPADDAVFASPPAPPSVFSLEGRAVPALYLIGWVGTLLGVSLALVAILGGGPGAPVLFPIALVIAAVGFLAAGGSQAIERSRRPELPYRGPSPLLAFGAVVTLTLLGVIAVLTPLLALGLDPASPTATALSLLLTTAAYVGVLALLVVGTGAFSWRELGLIVPGPVAARELLVGAAWAIPVLVLTAFVGVALRAVLGLTELPPSPLPPALDPLGIAANAVSAVILAPIGEELFFRGFATRAWQRVYGAWPAIVRGALFFSFAHIITIFGSDATEGAQQALFAFVVRLPVGIALGWLLLRRGSLWAPIGLHAVFNGLQVAALAAAG